MKTLVIYYSRTGNTRFAAETIAAEIGADVEEVVDLKNRQGTLNYLPAGRDALQGKETRIAETKRSPAGYGLIVIGQPVWAGSPTPAIRTYLGRTDLSGRKVALFFTDSGWGKAFEKTRALMPGSVFVGELALPAKGFKNRDETKDKIVEWCNTLKTA